jgi:hypothetical protein
MSKTIEESGTITINSPVHGAKFVFANPTQQLVFNRLVKRHGEPLNIYKGFGSDNVVMVEFPFMTIGIEEDGYAHS